MENIAESSQHNPISFLDYCSLVMSDLILGSS